jgi:hypothetical protein
MRLPLQIGRASLNQGARFAACVWLGPLFLIVGASFIGTRGAVPAVFGLGIPGIVVSCIAIWAAYAAKIDRASDIVLDDSGFVIEGGPLDKTHCKWSEVRGCEIVKVEGRWAVRWIVLSWLTARRFASINRRRDVPVKQLVLSRKGEKLVLAEAEGDEIESLEQLRDSIRSAVTPPKPPTQLPQEILKCPHCDAPLVPVPAARMTSTYCHRELDVPVELRERVRASIELDQTSGSHASTVRRLVDQPSARHAGSAPVASRTAPALDHDAGGRARRNGDHPRGAHRVERPRVRGRCGLLQGLLVLLPVRHGCQCRRDPPNVHDRRGGKAGADDPAAARESAVELRARVHDRARRDTRDSQGQGRERSANRARSAEGGRTVTEVIESLFTSGFEIVAKKRRLVVSVRQIGMLHAPTGRIVTGDAIGTLDFAPFTRLAPTGVFPVEASLVKVSAHESLIAAVRVVFSPRPVASWEPAEGGSGATSRSATGAPGYTGPDLSSTRKWSPLSRRTSTTATASGGTSRRERAASGGNMRAFSPTKIARRRASSSRPAMATAYSRATGGSTPAVSRPSS